MKGEVAVCSSSGKLSEARSLLYGATGMLLATWLLATLSLWFFAFYAIPVEAPDWVRRAQIACFGSNESGLPGPEGWMLLILSPLLFLGAMALALGDEMARALVIMRRTMVGRVVATGIVLLVLLEAYWVIESIGARANAGDVSASINPLILPETYPRGVELAPAFALVNQRGDRETLSSAGGKPVFVSFVFAHCQAVCPSLVKTITTAASELGPDRVRGMLITLDPWRDTPATLPGLARKWELGEGVSVLSGEPEVVSAVLDEYKVPRERNLSSGDVVHPSLVHVIGKNGELAYSFNNPSVEWLKEAVARIER